MNKTIPEGKFRRSVVTGKAAASVGGKVFKYLAKKPFLSADAKNTEKKQLEADSAKSIFKAMVLLKGTALKIAQALSLESEFIPEEIRAELEKSYNQVPPMNRVLVRKALINAFTQSPEDVFKAFDMKAIAAASLGQVHTATGNNNEKFAVKIQYPGISGSIKSDMQMIKGFLRPLPHYRSMKSSLVEIEKRLYEETDYHSEADNIQSFRKKLNIEDVVIPKVYKELSNSTVLTTDYVEGLTIDMWLKKDPPQKERDNVAAILYKIFMDSFYEHQCIHADPNPGNYIITDENKTCLVDFGCVKHFSKSFVANHREMFRVVIHKEKNSYISVLEKLNLISPDIGGKEKDQIYDLISQIMEWYSQLYEEEFFDFSQSADFLKEGRILMNELFRFWKNLAPNSEFVFLDRTRYGLFKLFESMGARVRMKNEYEC